MVDDSEESHRDDRPVDEPVGGGRGEALEVHGGRAGGSGEQGVEPPEHLEMVAPRLLTWPSQMMLATIAGLVLVHVVLPLLDGQRDPVYGWMTAIFLGAALVIVAGRLIRRPRRPQRLELATDHLVLPRNPNVRRRVSVRYDQIRVILRMQQRGQAVVLLDTSRGVFFFPQRMFAHPDALPALWRRTLAAVGALPDGRQRVERMHALARTAYETGENRGLVTVALLVAVVLVFGVQWFTGAVDNPFRLLRLGANSPALVADGQWFRLVSANFLHGHWLHLLANGVALQFLGVSLERLLGASRLLLLFLVSALGGAAASALANGAALSVGTSTALFGLLGALAILHLKHYRDLPPPYRQRKRWWAFILVVNTALPLALPVIDAAAHAGGFAAGALVAAIMLARQREYSPTRPPHRALRVACIILVAIFAAGLARAVDYALTRHPDDEARLARSYLDYADRDDGEALNLVAWTIATDADATREQLDIAHELIIDAVGRQPERAEFHDTHATVHYRIGRLEPAGSDTARDALREAIVLARALAIRLPATDYPSQLARFLDAHARSFGPHFLDEPVAAVPTLSLTRDGPAVFVTPGPSTLWHAPLEVFALVHHGERLAGLILVCHGRDRHLTTPLRVAGDDLRPLQSADARLTVALVSSAPYACPADTTVAGFWPMRPEIARLP